MADRGDVRRVARKLVRVDCRLVERRAARAARVATTLVAMVDRPVVAAAVPVLVAVEAADTGAALVLAMPNACRRVWSSAAVGRTFLAALLA